MKLRKTHQSKRKSYTYEFSNGEALVLEVGVDGVTEEDIKVLHDLDDQEVYYNNKNLKPKLTPAEKQQLKEWEEKQDWRMFDKNWTVSLDAYADDDESGDKNNIWNQVNQIATRDESEIKVLERLRASFDYLLPEQRRLLEQIYFKNQTRAEIAEEDGVNEAAIRNRLKKIYKKIEKNFD
jgi:DNA-directed RNA polymerase specialized sigma subunit, sigma24 homolog